MLRHDGAVLLSVATVETTILDVDMTGDGANGNRSARAKPTSGHGHADEWNAGMDVLDSFDRRILDLVQRDCQIKAEAIADAVGLSPSAVQRRLKRLRSDRVIAAEVAILDRRAVGQPMTFVAGLEIERENYEAISKFKAWAARQDHIQQVYYVTGNVDLIAIITARDVGHYDDITAAIMSQNQQIKRIHTNVVLRELKVGLQVPIDCPEPDDSSV